VGKSERGKEGKTVNQEVLALQRKKKGGIVVSSTAPGLHANHEHVPERQSGRFLLVEVESAKEKQAPLCPDQWNIISLQCQ